MTRPKKIRHPDSQVRRLALAVYKHRLGPDDTARMLAKDREAGDDEERLIKSRSLFYEGAVRALLEILEIEPEA